MHLPKPLRPLAWAATAALALFAVGGCTSLEEKSAAACTTYGFKPGTEAHAACTQQEVASRRAAAAAAAPPLDATLQPLPRRLPMRCTPDGFGGLRCN
jgi:hypothetical protein